MALVKFDDLSRIVPEGKVLSALALLKGLQDDGKVAG
jgi:hypothetical protein